MRQAQEFSKDKKVWVGENLLNDCLQGLRFLVFSQNQVLINVGAVRHLTNFIIIPFT